MVEKEEMGEVGQKKGEVEGKEKQEAVVQEEVVVGEVE